jgi:hypothetical protein
MDESDAEEEEINFMAVLFDRSQLGVAIFNALTTTLKVLQIDVRDAAELGQVGGSSGVAYPSMRGTDSDPMLTKQVLERLHTQFEVHKVVISSRNASAHSMLRLVKQLDERRETRTGVTVRKVRDEPSVTVSSVCVRYTHLLL